MGLQNTLSGDDQILAEVPVHGDPHALFFPGQTGTLTCTESQIIFDGKKNTVHISVDEISALEFQEPTWSRAYLYTGIVSLLYGILGGAPDSGFPTFGFVVGIVLLATGYWLRTTRLKIYTLGQTYNFTSRGNGLGQVAQAFRNREQNK